MLITAAVDGEAAGHCDAIKFSALNREFHFTMGGDCLADVAVLRAQPELAGPVASDR